MIDKATGNKASRDRPNTPRDQGIPSSKGRAGGGAGMDRASPIAGAHAADHLTNNEATPGSGALPSHHAHGAGKDVDGGAG